MFGVKFNKEITERKGIDINFTRGSRSLTIIKTFFYHFYNQNELLPLCCGFHGLPQQGFQILSAKEKEK